MKCLPNTSTKPTQTPSWITLFCIVILVTFMTASPLQKNAPNLSNAIKLLGYASILVVTARLLWIAIHERKEILQEYINAYSITLLWPTLFYFTGLLIGSLRGPAPLYSLQQTFSDAAVFIFAFIVFGWLLNDLNTAVCRLLIVVAICTGFLLAASLVVHIGNLTGWWWINPYQHSGAHHLLMNGPFNHSNHLAYVLMTGALSAATLAATSKEKIDWRWLILTGFLSLGVAITFGRGAILGTAIGIIGIIAIQHRRLAFLLFTLVCITTLFLIASYHIEGTLFCFKYTGSVNSIPNNTYTGYRDLSQDDWKLKVKRSTDIIALNQNGAITSEQVSLYKGNYTVVVYGHGSKGQSSEHDEYRTPIIEVSVWNNDSLVTSKSIQLTSDNDYLLGPIIEVNQLSNFTVQISFNDDAFSGPGNDRNVYLEKVYIAKSDVPIFTFPQLTFLPKFGFSSRSDLWKMALNNIKEYGPLGVGPGQAESIESLSMHNFFLEQFGEGGVLTSLGVLGWLILPIIYIKRSRLRRDLAWCIVAAMAGLMVHCIFWSQFLNGLRFLTLIYVSLWTALGTLQSPPKKAAVPLDSSAI